MERTEFKEWAEDLRRRLPELAAYVTGLDQSIRDVWFADIFAEHELRDALQMNYRIFTSGEGLAKYDRDKLPSLFIKMLGDIRHERHQREDDTKHAPYTGAFGHVTERDAVMRQAYLQVMRKQQAYREETGADRTPDHLRKSWVEESFEVSNG